MELQEIDVMIDKNGDVKIEVHGAKGRECLDLTAELEAALGGDTQRTMTPESGESVQQQTTDQQWLRE